MNNTYSYKWSKYPIHVFAENKKEAVEYLTKLGYNATMKNVHLLQKGKW